MQLGRLDHETTANVGMIEGGSAVNVVPDHCLLRGEVRGRDEVKLAAQLEHMLEALALAAAETGVDVEVDVHEDFHGYRHAPDALPLRIANAAMAEVGAQRTSHRRWRRLGQQRVQTRVVFPL